MKFEKVKALADLGGEIKITEFEFTDGTLTAVTGFADDGKDNITFVKITKASDYSSGLSVLREVEGATEDRTKVTGQKVVGGETVQIVKYFADKHEIYSESFTFARELEREGFSGLATPVKVLVNEKGEIIKELP